MAVGYLDATDIASVLIARYIRQSGRPLQVAGRTQCIAARRLANEFGEPRLVLDLLMQDRKPRGS
jgi:hypothetical protein